MEAGARPTALLPFTRVDTREEMRAAIVSPERAVTETPVGAVIRVLLSTIGTDPILGDPSVARVVQARRDEIAKVIACGIARGDLRPMRPRDHRRVCRVSFAVAASGDPAP